MPRGKKNKAATPIGRGKAGSLKRKAFTAGLGKKAVKTIRSMSRSERKGVKTALKIGKKAPTSIRAKRMGAGDLGGMLKSKRKSRTMQGLTAMGKRKKVKSSGQTVRKAAGLGGR